MSGPCGRDSCFQLFPGHTEECRAAQASAGGPHKVIVSECGCYVEGGAVIATWEIIHCPRHAAGPEALKAMSEVMGVTAVFPNGRVVYGSAEEVRKALNRVHEVLSKAGVL